MGDKTETKVEFVALRFSTLLFIIVIGFFVLLGIFQLKNIITNTTQMMYWVVCIGGLFTFFSVFLFWKTKIRGNIEFQNEAFAIQIQQKNQLDVFPYNEIRDYNIYNLPIKKMGVVLRINRTKNSFYWFVFENSNFFNTMTIIRNNLQNKLFSKKLSFLDYVIKGFFFLPIVLLVISILLLVGGLLYMIYFLE
ncbi:MAG: hypothetical protein LBE92_05565 [Chryseobacterium sp.]|jgi:hypothetical protein|uniref:hypothetical protein n=1 Tax=Chryseobacterium sp. TaxID=1871047 RepID=UPI002819EFB2|nr:hypothetical protein [Chryseobacterium sp.]MDR2235570.1 hypothetical protein [Chryseobacterium sp.]